MRRLGQTTFQDLERIQLYITAPYRSPPEVVIAENIENAIIEHNTMIAHNQSVYTDGSVVNGRVRAAAVCPKHQKTRSTYMGEQSEATQQQDRFHNDLLDLSDEPNQELSRSCQRWAALIGSILGSRRPS